MFGVVLTTCLQVSLAAVSANASPTNYGDAYREAERTGKPLVILVGADWCPGCNIMKNTVIPALKEEGELSQVSFATVNTDNERDLASKLMHGGSIPQLIVYQKTENGWEREQVTGAQSVSETRGLLRRVASRLIRR